MISKVQRAGNNLVALQGDFAGEEEALVDFKVDILEPFAKKILKRSPSQDFHKPIYKDDDLREPQNYGVQSQEAEEEKKSPEFPEGATEE